MINEQDLKENYMTIGETARFLAVNIETLRRWDRNGTFRASEKVGKRGDRYYALLHIATYLRLNNNRPKMPKLSVNDVDGDKPNGI